jgi:hypothetical protein
MPSAVTAEQRPELGLARSARGQAWRAPSDAAVCLTSPGTDRGRAEATPRRQLARREQGMKKAGGWSCRHGGLLGERLPCFGHGRGDRLCLGKAPSERWGSLPKRPRARAHLMGRAPGSANRRERRRSGAPRKRFPKRRWSVSPSPRRSRWAAPARSRSAGGFADREGLAGPGTHGRPRLGGRTGRHRSWEGPREEARPRKGRGCPSRCRARRRQAGGR